MTLGFAIGKGLRTGSTADTAVIIGSGSRAGSGGFQILGIHHPLVIVVRLAGNDLRLLIAAVHAGVNLFAVDVVTGILGNHAVVPAVGAKAALFVGMLTGGRMPMVVLVAVPLVGEGVTLGLAIQEGLRANLAADAAVVVFGRAGAGSSSFQILDIGVLLVKHVLRRGRQRLALLCAADGAGVNLGSLRGMGGLNGNHTGIPGVGAVVGGHVRVAAGVGVPVIVRVHRPLRAEGMAGRLTIGKGLRALFTAQAAVVIIGRAVRGSGRS